MKIDEGTPEIIWSLPYLMLDHGMKRNADLRNKLAEQGYEISLQQLGRIVNQPPERINLSLLVALCAVFHCDVGDIIRIDPMSTSYSIPAFDYQNLRYRDYALSPNELNYKSETPSRPPRSKAGDRTDKVVHLRPPKPPMK